MAGGELSTLGSTGVPEWEFPLRCPYGYAAALAEDNTAIRHVDGMLCAHHGAQWPIVCPRGLASQLRDQGLWHADGTRCQHYHWLVVLASKKRRAVSEMRDMLEEPIAALLHTTLVQYSGWLGQQLGQPLDVDELVDRFEEEVRRAG